MKFSRANDRVGPESLPVRPALEELQGTWFNVNPDSGEIDRILISVQGGVVSLDIFGTDADKLIPWGKGVAAPYVDRVGSSSVSGFLADYDLGFVKTRLAANLKYGVLVIQSYNEFCDGSGRSSYFTREFFSREVVHRPHDVAVLAGSSDLGHCAGEWMNTNPATNGITHFSLEAHGDGYRLKTFAAGNPAEWGFAEVIPHADGQGCAFLAHYELGFAEVTLAANENKGLIIIASYYRGRPDSGRPSYFIREFFYRREVVRG